MTPEQQIRQAVAKLPKVRFEKGWNDPKIAGRGTWSPRFVMLHHTAGTKSLGPLTRTAWPPVRGAHFLIDRDGLVRVLAASKAYHAGRGGPRWGVPAGAMNSYAWGIEIEDLGRAQTLTPAQVDSTAALTAGLLDAMGADLDAIIQHKEWNPAGKVDTRYSTAWWRDKVTEARTSAAPDGPAVSLERLRRLARRARWSRPIGRESRRQLAIVEDALRAEGLPNYRAWQESLGYTGPDADGIPGRASLDKLARRHGFTVTP